MLADKKPCYRPRVGHWHDKQISQPQREAPQHQAQGHEGQRKSRGAGKAHIQARPHDFSTPGRKPGLVTWGHQCHPTPPHLHDETHSCGAQGLAQEAGNPQNCSSEGGTLKAQQQRREALPQETPPAGRLQMPKTKRSPPHSLRAFAQAVPCLRHPPGTCTSPC